MLNQKKKTEREENKRRELRDISTQMKSCREYNAMKFDDLQTQVLELSAQIKQLNSLLSTTLGIVYSQSKKIVYMEKVARALEIPMVPIEIAPEADEDPENV